VHVHGTSIDVYGFDAIFLSTIGEMHSFSVVDFCRFKGDLWIDRNSHDVDRDRNCMREPLSRIGDFVAANHSTTWLVIVGFYFGKLGSKSD
jgi:hypothetical protein